MRKVTFGGASSLDNYIARADHTVDWLMWTDEVAAITAELWKTIDAVIMGRKTYEAAVRHGMAAYPGVRNYVCSRTMRDDPDGRVEVIREDAAEFVRELKAREGKGICVMGGGELAHSLFEAGLIDEIGFNVHPVLLGSGIPLYHAMSRQVDLELLECRVLKNGCVLVKYGVKH